MKRVEERKIINRIRYIDDLANIINQIEVNDDDMLLVLVNLDFIFEIRKELISKLVRNETKVGLEKILTQNRIKLSESNKDTITKNNL